MNKQLLFQRKNIHYSIQGTGMPVVMIHGFGEDGNIWNYQVEYLKDKFKLIMPDLPGSGQSEMIEDMSMEGMAEVIKSILDVEASEKETLDSKNPDSHLRNQTADQKQTTTVSTDSENPPSEGREACAMIGHSMGGYITLAFAEKNPEYLSALGLFHSTAYADSEEKKAIRRKGIDFINQHGAFAFLKTTMPNLFSQQTRDKRPELVSEMVTGLHNFSAASLVSYYESMIRRPDRTEMLQKATVPVLFIMGKYDNAVPLKDGLAQCHLPEKSYIYVLKNSGHMGMLEEKDLSNDILDKFLLDIVTQS